MGKGYFLSGLLLGIGVSLGLGFVALYLLIVQEILGLSLLSI